MTRLFFDTNIVLDLLIREEYKKDILELMEHSSDKRMFVSYLTVANAAYIMRKYPQEIIYQNISLILQLFEVVANDVEQIRSAIRQASPDFEDMLQYQSALAENCDVLLTRNANHFPYSHIPVMTVQEYLKTL